MPLWWHLQSFHHASHSTPTPAPSNAEHTSCKALLSTLLDSLIKTCNFPFFLVCHGGAGGMLVNSIYFWKNCLIWSVLVLQLLCVNPILERQLFKTKLLFFALFLSGVYLFSELVSPHARPIMAKLLHISESRIPLNIFQRILQSFQQDHVWHMKMFIAFIFLASALPGDVLSSTSRSRSCLIDNTCWDGTDTRLSLIVEL